MKQTLLALLLSLATTVAWAATPVGPMNYQGRLLNDQGIPVTGSYNFVVKIYDDPATGTLKYQETKTGVAVNDGVYSFRIGTGPKTGGDSVWDVDLWQLNLNDLYLEVVVNGETLTPRHELTSAPHAFTSTLALHANTVGYLGGQSTDNMLVAICKSSRGVWLNLANKCLGPGADFSVAAVGGSVVTLASLHSGTDLTGIDLSQANIAGINFGAANLSKATFKNTTYNSNGIKGCDLSSSNWEEATDLNTVASTFTNSLNGATIKKMNLSKWNLSGLSAEAQHKWLSAAVLSACPAALPNADSTNHDCVEQVPGSGQFGIIGMDFRLSADSAAVDAEGNLKMPDIAAKNITEARFDGARITQDFANNWMDSVNFENATLVGNTFINNSLMQNLDMDGARMDGVRFYGQSSSSWSGWSLVGASLKNVMFETTGSNVPSNFNFTGAHLSNVYFPEMINVNFTDAVLDSIALDVDGVDGGKNPGTNFNFTNAKLTGNLRLDLASKGTGLGCPAPIERPNYRSNLPGVRVYNATFLYDADNTSGCPSMDDGISMAQFSNCTIVRTEFATHGRLTNFSNCTFKEVVVKSTANFNGALFTSSAGYDNQIWWEVGAICPNNIAVTNAGYSTTAGVGCNGKW